MQVHVYEDWQKSRKMRQEQEERWFQDKNEKDIIYLAWRQIGIDNDFLRLWEVNHEEEAEWQATVSQRMAGRVLHPHQGLQAAPPEPPGQNGKGTLQQAPSTSFYTHSYYRCWLCGLKILAHIFFGWLCYMPMKTGFNNIFKLYLASEFNNDRAVYTFLIIRSFT